MCLVNSGHSPDEMNDNMIVQDTHVDKLVEGERVKTVTGYRSSAPKYTKSPGTIWTEAKKREMKN